MADGVNYCCVGGNLGSDPETRVTQGGTTVMTMSIGCNSSYLDKNRVRQETVEWVRVVVFGKRAEGLAKFLRKGAKVFCEGSMKTSSWEDREGIKRYKTEIIASNVLLGGSNNPRNKPNDPEHRRPGRRDGDDDDVPPDRSAPSQGGGGGGSYDDYDGGDDDDSIPF